MQVRFLPGAHFENMKLTDIILFEDDNLLAVNKPPGLLVHETEHGDNENTLEDLVLEYSSSKLERAGIVHRLDRETSGVLVIAKKEDIYYTLKHLFKSREVHKEYTALVWGSFPKEKVSIRATMWRSKKDPRRRTSGMNPPPNIRSREAHTDVERLRVFADYSLVAAFPKTGRTHQIRAHLAWYGFPVVCDQIYQFRNQTCPEGLKRMFLHAKQLSFDIGNHKYEIEAPLPHDLQSFIKLIP